jgi:PPP family 3-phenylpropionic acid transporter
MRAVRAEYFFAYAVSGSVLPYLPIYFHELGLTDQEIGYVFSTTGLAVLVTPGLLTLLADMRMDSRRLLAGAFAVSAAAFVALLFTRGFWSIFLAHSLFSLAFVPIYALLDGLTFAAQERRAADGQRTIAYHHIRVFGTIGFIAPSLLLYVLLTFGAPIAVSLVTAIVLALLGTVTTVYLPKVQPAPAPAADATFEPAASEATADEAVAAEWPTVSALRSMLSPHVAVFCVGMWMLHMAVSAYYAFFPLYLTQTVGIEAQWVGLVINLGVVIEIFFVLGFGRMLDRLGVAGLMTLGAAATAVRFAMMFLMPTVAVAVASQAMHGLLVLAVHVVPPVYLNQQAKNHYRNSMQGLYVMSVTGTGRIAGNVVSGHLASASIGGLFGFAGALCAVAAVLFGSIFSARHRKAGVRAATG